jgi:hypothetical protein
MYTLFCFWLDSQIFVKVSANCWNQKCRKIWNWSKKKWKFLISKLHEDDLVNSFFFIFFKVNRNINKFETKKNRTFFSKIIPNILNKIWPYLFRLIIWSESWKITYLYETELQIIWLVDIFQTPRIKYGRSPYLVV